MLFSSGTALVSLGLALMIGGMLALGAFTAPVLFSHFDRIEAGAAMTTIFRRYDTVLLIALALLLVGEGLRLYIVPTVLNSSWLHVVRSVSLGLLVLAAALSLGWLNPQMERAQKDGIALLSSNDPKVVAFNTLHHRSEQLYKLQLLLAVIVLLTTPFVSAPEA